jgi:glucose/arabinose dehydrogenase
MSRSIWRSMVVLTLVAAVSACSEKASLEPAQQSGAAPPLPKARDFLLPPMEVPTGVGWAQGQSPKVAPGLRIEKIASGLMHPRQVYVLPNGDVLVAESNGPGTEPVTMCSSNICTRLSACS